MKNENKILFETDTSVLLSSFSGVFLASSDKTVIKILCENWFMFFLI